MQMDLWQQGTHDVLKATGNIYKLGYWAKNANPTSLDIMRNINKEKILKEGTKQQKWKKTGPRVHVLTLQQKMSQDEAR